MSLKSSTKIKQQQQQQRKKGASDNKVNKQKNFSVVVKKVTSRITKKATEDTNGNTKRAPISRPRSKQIYRISQEIFLRPLK